MAEKISIPERYVVNFDNPDCGVGHAIGYLNGQLKVALRNDIQLAYSSSQLRKSTNLSLMFLAKRIAKRVLLGRSAESHNLGNDLDVLFAPRLRTSSRDRLYSTANRSRYTFLMLPDTQIPVDWREHDDAQAYKEIDTFIQEHPDPFTVFVLPKNWQPDCEFETTRQWFQDAYRGARGVTPIKCSYSSDRTNIAVHIRRGDILPGRPFESLSSRLLPDDWYLARVTEVCSAIDGQKHIKLISEGTDGHYVNEHGVVSTAFEELGEILKTSVSLHLDRSFLDDFHDLVSADIMIGSRSGMSHLAAVISDGVKIVPSMWHSFRGVDHVVECDPGQPTAVTVEIRAAIQGSVT